MPFFEKPISVRITEEQHKQIDSIVAKNPEIYESVNHFIRIAIMKEINFKREE